MMRFEQNIIHMNPASCVMSENDQGSIPKPFQCTCGKGYKSYPALYTHIKNKHDGKPPGDLKKPTSTNKKRGRPITRGVFTTQSFNRDSQENLSTSILSIQEMRQKLKSNFTAKDCIHNLAQFLMKLPSEKLNKTHLNEIPSILQMNIYLAAIEDQKEGYYIGVIIKEFLGELSRHISWQKFQSFYTLLMFLVQFVIEETGNGKTIKEGSVDLLCDYINHFLQIGVQNMIKVCQIDETMLFRNENMIEVFEFFFQWLMMKRYTNYKISLNSQFKRVETQAQF